MHVTKINRLTLVLLMFLKTVSVKSKTKMKWNKVISEQVPLLSGVKQGGILSTLSPTLYVDILLEKLSNQD